MKRAFKVISATCVLALGLIALANPYKHVGVFRNPNAPSSGFFETSRNLLSPIFDAAGNSTAAIQIASMIGKREPASPITFLKFKAAPIRSLKYEGQFGRLFPSFEFVASSGSNERIVLPGFSVSPPGGENWIERRLPEPDPNDYGLQKRLQFVKALPQNPEYGPHTAFAEVNTIFLPRQNKRLAAANLREFMRFRMKYAMARDKVSLGSGQRLISQQAGLDNSIGYTCFKYNAVLEDRGVKGFPDTAFTIDYYAYECIDPAMKMIVSLSCFQAAHSEARLNYITQECEKFLKSIKFTARLS